jgi:YVTN family beta-propeller protein
MSKYSVQLVCFMLVALVCLPAGAFAQTNTTIPVGVAPRAVAVNPVTNKIYVVNFTYTGGVTVIDGVSGSATNIVTGNSPAALAVNPVTNKIYVANYNGNNVTVIDGATNTTKTLKDAAATGPAAVAVNPETNKVYIGNYKSRNVTVIDGATDSISATVSFQNPFTVTGVNPLIGIAVNPASNKVYVTDYNDNSVTVIDGANSPTRVVVGTNPCSVAVDTVNQKAYVTNYGSSSVTVIDSGNATSTILVGVYPKAVSINPGARKIYVVNLNSGIGSVSVIDGTSDSVVATLPVESLNSTVPVTVTANTVTNKIYVTNDLSNSVTVIDGLTSTVYATLTVGTEPDAAAVNMLTNVLYVANRDPSNPMASPPYGSVTVIPDAVVPMSPLITAITTFPGNVTASSSPTFTLNATSITGSPVRKVNYQMDSIQGAWQSATVSGGSYSASATNLTPGVHTLYAFATDGNDATTINTGSQSSPLTGAIVSYSFTVTGAPPVVTYTVTPQNTGNGSITPFVPQVVEINKVATFTVTPDTGYTIDSVTGCNGTLTGNSYTTEPVTADCTVISKFKSTLLPVRIGSAYYQTLQEAYAAAAIGAVIQATATNPFTGGLTLNRTDIAVTLQGGYDDTFTTQTGSTIIAGGLSLGSGSLVADRLTVR